VKQQLQGGMHSSTLEAVKTIWKKKGISGFYEGYSGGLARDVPFRVAQLTSYEVLKHWYLETRRKGDEINYELSSIESALCGAVAGTFSSGITTPLDRIKTLLMTDSASYGGSVASCAGKIFREEGVAGFFTGLLPRIAYVAPSVAIFFVAYENVQQRLLNSNLSES